MREQLQVAQAQAEMKRKNHQDTRIRGVGEKGSTDAVQHQERLTVRFLPLPDSAKLMGLAAWTATSSLICAPAQDSPLPHITASPLIAPWSWQILTEQVRSHISSTRPTPKVMKKPLKYHLKGPYWREAMEGDIMPEEKRR